MKNTVTIALDDAKVSALKMYLDMKKTSLDEQITRYAEQLYDKIVPPNVRDFIKMTAKRQNVSKPKSVYEKPTNQP